MGNTFDGIYEVSSVETLTRDVVGISTTVKRIFVDASSVPSGYSSGITTSDYGLVCLVGEELMSKREMSMLARAVRS